MEAFRFKMEVTPHACSMSWIIHAYLDCGCGDIRTASITLSDAQFDANDDRSTIFAWAVRQLFLKLSRPQTQKEISNGKL